MCVCLCVCVRECVTASRHITRSYGWQDSSMRQTRITCWVPTYYVPWCMDTVCLEFQSVAVSCSELQHILCCCFLQCVEVCCRDFRYDKVYCSALQCYIVYAVCCSVLQCAAVCCSLYCSVLQRYAAHCSMLQCVAVHCMCCSLLRYVAVWCSV